MSDTVILDGDLSLSNVLDGQGGAYNRYDWRGYSAYEIAVQEGFEGTKAEWLASLQGEDGATGPQGPQGVQGIQGPKGDPGDDYILTEQDKQEIAGMVDTPVDDVQINGTSILSNGVANVPLGDDATVGVVRTGASYGIKRWSATNPIICINHATDSMIKDGGTSISPFRPITPDQQHMSMFYGLAKAAGDTTQSQSSNEVGAYTEDAKSAISDMLNGSVSVSGTTPTIVAKSGIRYVCGEVSTLDLTPPASGICDVVFTSGTTPTVLTVPSTVKWANGFDPTSLDANTTYELNVMDGLGVCGTWT